MLLDGDPVDLDRVWSTDPTLGGDDIICTGTSTLAGGVAACTGGSDAEAGADIVVGGTGADTIWGGTGRNIVLGDNGRFTAVPDETRQWGYLPMASGTLTTTDPTIGGGDVITTLGGQDVDPRWRRPATTSGAVPATTSSSVTTRPSPGQWSGRPAPAASRW